MNKKNKQPTQEQRQAVYERLVALKVPETLAALIASRLTFEITDVTQRLEALPARCILLQGFILGRTPEGHSFWEGILDELKDRNL